MYMGLLQNALHFVMTPFLLNCYPRDVPTLAIRPNTLTI